LGAGKGAVCDPELLFDLVLAELKKDPENKTFLPYFDECIEAHRQREDALGMASETKMLLLTLTLLLLPLPQPQRPRGKNASKCLSNDCPCVNRASRALR
jgi:hypothetical protein